MRKLAATVRSMLGLRFELLPQPRGTRSGHSVRALNGQGTNAEVAIVDAGVVAAEVGVSAAANRRRFP